MDQTSVTFAIPPRSVAIPPRDDATARPRDWATSQLITPVCPVTRLESARADAAMQYPPAVD